jgi:hypothetical protein
MPAKKPRDLIVRDETNAMRNQREAQADALTPDRSLGIWEPKELTGDKARETWRKTVRLYLTLDARIASVLDKPLLIDYCNVTEQQQEIDDMRATAILNYKANVAILTKLLEKESDKVDAKELAKLNVAVNQCYDAVLKLDARADQKRKLLHSYRQSLLLTPRSRGGVNPNDKPKEEPQSEMDKLLDGEIKPEKGKKKVVKNV